MGSWSVRFEVDQEALLAVPSGACEPPTGAERGSEVPIEEPASGMGSWSKLVLKKNGKDCMKPRMLDLVSPRLEWQGVGPGVENFSGRKGGPLANISTGTDLLFSAAQWAGFEIITFKP
eukprot:gene3135-13148_t